MEGRAARQWEGRAEACQQDRVVQQQEDRAAPGPLGEDKVVWWREGRVVQRQEGRVVRRQEGTVEACQRDRAVLAADLGVVLQVLAEGVGLVHLQSAGPPQWWAALPQSVCG